MQREVISVAAIFLFAFSAAAQTQAEATAERTYNFKAINGQHEMDEMATLIRQVAGTDVKAFDVSTNMIAVRGTSEQAALANWLVDQLDIANSEPGVREYKANDGSVARVYYTANVSSPLSLQELITTLRQTAEIHHLFNFTDKRAIAVRGTATQVAFADWLVQGIDRSTPGTATLEYAVGGNKDDQARIFYLPVAYTPQNFQTLMSAMRRTAGIMKGFECISLHALAVRGTADQIAKAEKLFAEQVQVNAAKRTE